MNTEAKLIELEQVLAEYCSALYARILPPLEYSEISHYFKKWNIDDPTLIEIFSWKNGIEYDSDLPTHSFDFTGFGVIPSLAYINEILELEKFEKSWKKSLFPLITSFAGDFLLYETDKSSRNYGQLFLFSPNLGYVDFQVEYFDSVATMIDTIKQCFVEGIFSYSASDMSFNILDYKLRSKIAKMHNPNSEYWQQR